ncbi:hypothetical protein JTE90_011102 [Oedothorax gibbosus]|uniref:Uncharacterized protein n=1 Tax=Oedothorax gibbosus TaxID=931172 RepID=A0AAV6U140_9ARAC|nr:hypothetical protein JTE90_011102 [Oedothorax gibbosus]
MQRRIYLVGRSSYSWIHPSGYMKGCYSEMCYLYPFEDVQDSKVVDGRDIGQESTASIRTVVLLKETN